MRLGIKAHWRDVDAMVAVADRHGARVLEYQMLPGDLEKHRAEATRAFAAHQDRFEIRVHQPETYLADGVPHFLDISSPRVAERAPSVAVLTDVAAFAKELDASALIIHPGGNWVGDEAGGSPLILRDSLENLARDMPVLLENMPWFYDIRTLPGAIRGHPPAAFRTPSGLARVDDLVDGYVLDISHAYLAVESGSLEVPRAFVKELGARITHVHASGARGGIGGEGEGVSFDASDYDVAFVHELLANLHDDVVVVPEIMDGHADGGKGFDDALRALRNAK